MIRPIGDLASMASLLQVCLVLQVRMHTVYGDASVHDRVVVAFAALLVMHGRIVVALRFVILLVTTLNGLLKA